MKFSTNLIIQILGTVVGVGAQCAPILPAKAANYVTAVGGAAALGAQLVQAITGLIAHFRNPDGKPATEPYTPAPAK